MDCAEFREVLHELDRVGTPGAASFDAAMLHAEACGDCGVRLVEQESLGFALQKVARESARMPAAARVEAALLDEFRKSNVSAPAASNISVLPLRKKTTWQIVALGVAAALLLALGSVLYQRNLANAPGTPAPSVAANNIANTVKTDASSVPVANNLGVSVAPASTSNPAASSNVAAGTTRTAAANSSEPTEYATAYVPLPYADDPSALEGGSVVRVTLGRSTLESYGLPVDGLGAGDRVTADMIVSEDGTPQAIRLVSQAD
ncbi:MAG TPA: hypothetical protein VGD60_04620 [Candidatus Acidoferrales bacterium]